MGLQGKDMSAGNGASVIVIDQACDNDQLLVSLSKNGHQWLSPVGWTDQQKVTLLECRSQGDTTQVDIPAEFARDIKTGDVVVLRCSELDLEKEIIWETSEVETRPNEAAAEVATGLAGGLFSRFKAPKVELREDSKSEAELRAEEAERAAQTYKAKMEAAAAAKEEAQRKALDAAREAEAALKMEAERIAEMERAAKAFEEAERLKQDELRRVEEERRAEEARLAEEARRIEEARKREIAAKKEAARKAALKRYESGLDITRNEELRLKSRLKDLKRKAKSDAANIATQQEDLKSRHGLLVTSEETAEKRFESYDKTASKLDELNADLSLLQSESETLTADREALSIRLSQADSDYQHAQKEAEAAMAKAEARRAELDHLRQEESDVSGKILSVSEKLAAKGQAVTTTSDKAEKLQSSLETAQAELAQAKIEIEALEQALAVQAEQDQNLRLEIEATQQAIEDSQARQAAQQEAIEHLERGGAPEDIAEVDFEARSLEASAEFTASEDVERVNEIAPNPGLKDRMMGRVRQSFAREKDAEISIAVEDVIESEEDAKVDPVLLAGLEDTPSFLRRHSSSLMVLGAVIGGLALIGGGWALNQSAAPKLEVKSSTSEPTQVAGAVSKIEMPKASELTTLETADKLAPTLDSLAADVTPPTTEVPDTGSTGVPTMVDSPAISPVLEPLDVKSDEVLQSAKTPTEIEEDTLVLKLAEVVDPTGFAFELPDMMPIAEPPAPGAKTAVKKSKASKPEPKKAASKKAEKKLSASPKKVSAKPTAKEDADVNYPELTTDVQRRLSNLGLYTGDIDGLQGKATKEAITNFKTLFSMAETNSKITGALLTELKRAEREQEAAALQAQAAAEAERAALEAQSALQVADVAPAVTYYDTVQSVPSTPVISDTLPAADAFTPVIEATPSYIAPEPEVEAVKVASVPPVISEPAPTPVIQDVIVEATMLRNASASYPSSAQRRNYFVNVAIEVSYDIDTAGRPVNIAVLSNDHSGRFVDAFEKEAMGAIRKMRFSPKTVNGTAVTTTGKQKRIVFRAE